jgi:hypothetical protein
MTFTFVSKMPWQDEESASDDCESDSEDFELDGAAPFQTARQHGLSRPRVLKGLMTEVW